MSKNNFKFITNEKSNIPFNYNETKIVILPRDLDTIFIYWDISNSTIAELQSRNINLHFVLRIRNSDGKNFYFINTQHNARDWYFSARFTNLSKKNIVADLGVYDSYGNFLVICTSNIINLPTNNLHQKDYNYWKKLLSNNQNFNLTENLFISSRELIKKK